MSLFSLLWETPPSTSAKSKSTLFVSFSPEEHQVYRRGENVSIGTIGFQASEANTTVHRLAIALSGNTKGTRDLQRARLFDGDILIGSGAHIDDDTILFSNLGNFVVRPEQKRELRLEVEFSQSAQKGATIGFSLRNSSAIMVKTDEFDERMVSGDFPLHNTEAPIIGAEGNFFFSEWAASSPFFSGNSEEAFASLRLHSFSEEPLLLSEIALDPEGSFPEDQIRKIFFQDAEDPEKKADCFSGKCFFSPPLELLPLSTKDLYLFIEQNSLPPSAEGRSLFFEITTSSSLVIQGAEAANTFPIRSPSREVCPCSRNISLNPQISFLDPGVFGNFAEIFLGDLEDNRPLPNRMSFQISTGASLFPDPPVLTNTAGTLIAKGQWTDTETLLFSEIPQILLVSGERLFLSGKVSPEAAPQYIKIAQEENVVFFGISAGSGTPLVSLDWEPFPVTLTAGLPDALLGKIHLTPSSSPILFREFVWKGAGDIFENARLADSSGMIFSGIPRGKDFLFSLEHLVNTQDSFSLLADPRETSAGGVSLPKISPDDFFFFDEKKGISAMLQGSFPLALPVHQIATAPKKEDGIFLVQQWLPGSEFSRGEEAKKIFSFSLESEKEARIEQIRISFTNIPRRFFSKAVLIGENGEKISGSIDENFISITAPIRLSAGKNSFSLLVDISSGAPATEAIQAIFLGKGSFSGKTPVFGHFPQEGALFWGHQFSETAPEADSAPLLSATGPFSDVSESFFSAKALWFFRERGIVNGFADGSFRPEKNITRAEFTKILIMTKFSEKDLEGCVLPEDRFADVSEKEWYIPFLCLSVKEGIISGFPDGTFRPHDPLSFASAAKMIAQAFDADLPEDTELWYRPSVAWMKEKKAVPDGITLPSHQVRRGEMAEMLFRVLQNP